MFQLLGQGLIIEIFILYSTQTKHKIDIFLQPTDFFYIHDIASVVSNVLHFAGRRNLATFLH